MIKKLLDRYMLIKIVIFITILLFLVVNLSETLYSLEATESANQTGMEYVKKYKNSYDICFLGPSTAIYNVSNQQLYEKYGIAGISVAEPYERLYLTRYTLEEVFQYQKPKLVLLETSGIFYDEKDIVGHACNKQEYVHNIIDVIDTYSIKKRALNNVREYNPQLDVWNYYSKLYYAHSNWKSMSKKNFKAHDYLSGEMNGNAVSFDISEETIDYYSNSIEEYVEWDSVSHNKEYLEDIIRICDENNVDLILITSRVSYSKSHNVIVSKLAKEYDLKYVNINEYIDNIEFKYKLDTRDPIHFNLSGAIKWTDFIGEYLVKNYDLPDRRLDEKYDWYKQQSEMFNKQKKLIYAKQSLLSATNFDEYLKTLNELNNYENTILVSVYDEATQNLSEIERTLLSDLGLTEDLNGKFRCSYAAVINGGEIKEEISLDNTVSIEVYMNDTNLKVVSGGYTSGGNASILINGQEHIQKGRGFNIVVYNKSLKQVISSVFFDTYLYSNPPQRRFTTESLRLSQYQIEPNVWVTER